MRVKIVVGFMGIAGLLLSVISPILAQSSPSAINIIKTIEQNMSPSSVKARYLFTNYRSDGTISTYDIEFIIKDFDHSFGRFSKPEREKGREILRLNEAIWTFIPSVGRAIRIADRDSFAGGDFSNADILRLDWSTQYLPVIIKTTPHQWILDLDAKGPSAAYAKIRLWVNQASGQPVQAYFYDSNNTLLKRCLYGPPAAFGPFNRPARTVMENVITGQKSEMKVLTIVPLSTLSDSRFVIDNLGK